jgi:hypothetical protein
MSCYYFDPPTVNAVYRIETFVVFCEESIDSDKILLKLRYNFAIIGLEVCRSGIVECFGKIPNKEDAFSEKNSSSSYETMPPGLLFSPSGGNRGFSRQYIDVICWELKANRLVILLVQNY